MSLQNNKNEGLAEQQSTNEIKYWLGVKQEAKLEGVKCLEEAAKQVIVTTSLLQGIYFAAISFSDIKKIGNIGDFWFDVFVVLSLVALASWMSSLYFATRVFMPESYKTNTSQSYVDFAEQAREISDAYDRILGYKYSNLRRSFKLLWISFPSLAINILVYLALLPAIPLK